MAWLKKLYIDGKLGPYTLPCSGESRQKLITSIVVIWQQPKNTGCICKSPFHETMKNKLIVQMNRLTSGPQNFLPELVPSNYKPVITHADVRWISYGSSSNNRDQDKKSSYIPWYSVSEISLNTRKLCLNVSDITTWVGDHPIPTGEKFRVIKSRLLSINK